MKKLIAVFIATLLCLSLLAGCTSTVEVAENVSTDSSFVMVEHAAYWQVVYHKETKVMYVVSDGSYNHGTFTLLVNPDGTPMLYKDG